MPETSHGYKNRWSYPRKKENQLFFKYFHENMRSYTSESNVME